MLAIIAAAAIFGASVSASSAGSAHVVNMCSYDVYLCNVPSADGGYEETNEYLKAGQSWSQPWTQLSNGNGWSIKLSKTDALANILQYEYTWHDDGIIWYDLSCVNGNPWDGNWEITSSTSGCSPRQAAYRYATDDAYGMQSCPQDASITVTLCSGEATNNGTYGDSGENPEASTSAAATPVQVAPSETPVQVAPTESSAPAPVTYGYNFNNADLSASLKPSVTSSTFATQVTEVAVIEGGAVVNMVETQYVTEYVTAYAAKPRARRHQHHGHHLHAHHHHA